MCPRSAGRRGRRFHLRGADAGPRGGGRQEALAVLFDCRLGERIQIGDDGGAGSFDVGAGAVFGGGEAVLQLPLQRQRQEAACDMLADCFVELVKDRPR